MSLLFYSVWYYLGILGDTLGMFTNLEAQSLGAPHILKAWAPYWWLRTTRSRPFLTQKSCQDLPSAIIVTILLVPYLCRKITQEIRTESEILRNRTHQQKHSWHCRVDYQSDIPLLWSVIAHFSHEHVLTIAWRPNSYHRILEYLDKNVQSRGNGSLHDDKQQPTKILGDVPASSNWQMTQAREFKLSALCTKYVPGLQYISVNGMIWSRSRRLSTCHSGPNQNVLPSYCAQNHASSSCWSWNKLKYVEECQGMLQVERFERSLPWNPSSKRRQSTAHKVARSKAPGTPKTRFVTQSSSMGSDLPILHHSTSFYPILSHSAGLTVVEAAFFKLL